jgi:DNA repair exonuclease SbcCD ATPase subunit
MRLELSNFKCHETKEFEFTENNVVLVSGKSGVGKTSIMEAIVFVLFGSGRKITKHGQKSCYVRLQIKVKGKALDIKRTKGPNRLTVEYCMDNTVDKPNHYEDAAAQGIIDELFGHQYESVGYLSQSSVNSFVLMGPQEKLTFLENLVFKSSELKDIKQKIQNLVKERTQLLQTMIGKIEMLSEIISNETDADGECPDFPIRKESGSLVTCEKEHLRVEKNISMDIKNVSMKIESADKKLGKLSKMLTAREEEEFIMNENTRAMILLSTKVHSLEERFGETNAIDMGCIDMGCIDMGKKIDNRIDIIQGDIVRFTKTYEKNKEILELNKTKKKYYIIVEELAVKTNQYDELFATEKENLRIEKEMYKEKIVGDDAEGEINKEISENIDFCQSIGRYQELTKEKKEILEVIRENCNEIGGRIDYQSLEISLGAVEQSFNNKISSYEKDIEEIVQIVQKHKLAGIQYSCPECSEHLSFCTKTLCLVKRTPDLVFDNDLDSIELKLSKKRKSLDRYRTQWLRFKRNWDTLSHIGSKLKKLINIFDESDLESGIEDIEDIQERTRQLEDLIRANKEARAGYKEIQRKLKHASLSNHILSDLFHNIGSLQKSIDLFKKPTKLSDDDDDETELIKQNATIAADIENYRPILKKLVEIKAAVGVCVRERESFEKKTLANGQQDDKKLTIKSIRKHIENNTTEKERYGKLRQDYAEQQHNIEKWKLLHQRYKKITKYKDDLFELEEGLLTMRAKLHAIFKIKEFVKTSETVLLARAIDQVNQYVANYLDLFFQTDPIIVMLAVKQEEKTTARNGQLCISIDYKGMDADLSILSGGELQRVVIAYNLALAELFAVPIVLLDECTSNLDQELTETVVKGIKHNCKGKTMIMIAHQVVSGLFDNVILIT